MSASYPAQLPAPVTLAPDKLARIQAEFSQEWLRIASGAQLGTLEKPADRRFSGKAWESNTGCLLAAHAYLLSGKVINQMIDAAQASEPVRQRLRFTAMQWLEAVSPSNFLATNPDVQRTLLESNGESLRLGLQNLLVDFRKGRVSQTDESHFEIGKNVANTEGAVVFQNPIMQLIQYTPLTDNVHRKPLLIVPPCINKYYILDLQPENSFVRHAIEQGFTVFLISWRNPQASDADPIDTATWGDYLQHGVLQAIDVAADISGQDQINALGFCVGGTLLASALALARAQGKEPVSALTLLTTLLDFEDTGVLEVFVDELHAQVRDRQLGKGGLMAARELGTTFSFLRPNELVWNYVVNNYLKGEAPPAFDLLFWNADGTNLPGPFFTWYFRNTYLENNLKVPGRITVDGYPLDLGTLAMPTYIFGSREDHIVPWQAAYASTKLLRGPIRFLLGASGHIAGVINHPAKKRRSYWVHDANDSHSATPADPQDWLDAAAEHPGSWWPDWSAWLASHSGNMVAARRKLGNDDYAVLQPAPGDYVKVRTV
ncbi:class I poly(R)-hydroxyalkanoic acid synthase [Candidimonas sp. SYP-B2681]|uniref:class I poly(R)-hydroxyalkanoic acid synthase n=1 Tax=Candidimonas sp. SYP-B2681 TaxID=2497686 RepID=UPI000F87861A|nr:class I poly(R)-hydroxyalkanoic acid synthase [Candidimonas sp. SYP-B2681]RTZ44487.1 class I poly(R)-hydroxyalkanoic acid synthase [Candidimonas sp. SYP-B2681]